MGRPSKPWWDQEKGNWFTTIAGRKHNLGPDPGVANQKFRDLLSGIPLPDRPLAVGEVPLFDRLVKEYLVALPLWAKPGTVHEATMYLKPFRAAWGSRRSNTITPAEVKALVEGRAAWGPGGKRAAYSRLSNMFNWAVREHAEWGLGNPAKKVKWPPPRTRSISSVPTAEQYQKLLAAVGPYIQDILEVLSETGARIGEITRATAADYHKEAAVLVLAEHKSDGTAGRPRVIHLTPKAAAICDRLAEKYPTGAMFRSRYGKPYANPRNVSTTVRKARQRLGLPDGIVVHGLRHGFATSLLASGESDVIVAALLGHKSGTQVVNQNYSHVNQMANVLKAAIARRPKSEVPRSEHKSEQPEAAREVTNRAHAPPGRSS
jgi:integrase